MLTWFQIGIAAYWTGEKYAWSLEDQDWESFMAGVEAYEDCYE